MSKTLNRPLTDADIRALTLKIGRPAALIAGLAAWSARRDRQQRRKPCASS